MTSTTSPTERVGRYQLLDPIGIGPSGTVSRAKVFGVAGFERQFAVKRFHAELTTTAAMAAMLSAAARAYGSLEHPRIARMSEFGVAQGATFTAVEYVVGLDALRLIAETRLAGVALAAGGALALVSQAARAVGYAHGRGLTHLGLSPTNVIITADGDIKITDFGILSATLAQRPIEVPRLAQRIPYLTPEQLANEATSAATDVFALGVLAYELVTGMRAFRGDTPHQVAQAIMGGPPPEPALPRPIVRVLQRCLARSPFERFPDARALADALDAALRVAPVPGTRKDVGAQVKETLDRLAALNEGQMSGMVALHIGTGPIRALAPLDPPDLGVDLDPGPPPAYALGRPDTGEPITTPGPGSTLPDLPRGPVMTMPGLPPPPIPIPPGIADVPIPPPPGQPTTTSTLLGIGKSPPGVAAALPSTAPPTIPAIPRVPLPPASTAEPAGSSPRTIRPRPNPGPGSAPSIKPPAVPERALRPPQRSDGDLAVPIELASPGARIDAANDGPIHTLDPSDLLTVEGNDDDSARADSRSDTTLPRTPAQGDPNLVDTKPFPPVSLERSLFDPIVRPEAPDVLAEADAAAAAAQADDSHDDHPSQATSYHLPAAPPAGDPQAPADPRFARTMLGFASPLRPPADGAPSAGQGEPGPGQPGDSPGFDPAASPPSWAPVPAEPDPSLGASPYGAAPSMHPSAATPGSWVGPPPAPPGPYTATSVLTPPQRRPLWILIGMLGAVLIGISAWQIFHVAPPGDDARPPHERASPEHQKQPAPAATVAPPPSDAATVPGDATRVAVADEPLPAASTVSDAGAAAPAADARSTAVADARVATAIIDSGPLSPTAGGDTLSIASTPSGARVFLDGADTGATPLKLPGSPDRHTIALLLAGHELYIAQVDGHGTFQIPLKEVTPTNGPAGIKVLRCKDKDRYYVFIDGKPTGQTCPTERIGCELGPHTVEVYDVVSETRRKWDVVVKDTRLSFRVRVE